MPKIIGGSLHEHRLQTRLRLFDALSSLMAERGFDAITLSDIAAAAGIGRTAVYNHFPDKESLLLGLMANEAQKYVAKLEQALAGIDEPVQQLRTYIRQQANLTTVVQITPGPELPTVVSRGTRSRLREHAAIVEDLLRRILASGIALGEFPQQDIDTSVQLVNACLSHRTFPEDSCDRETAIAATETFILRAVGSTSAVPAPR